MEFHPKKCKVIHITNKRKRIEHDYTIHDQTLEVVTKADYLGVTLDSKMTWNDHVNKVCKKANMKLGFLRRNLASCPKPTRETCYKMIVRPILDYCSSVWDPHTKQSINKLEQVQRRACRFVCGRYRRTESVTEMMGQTKWPTLEERRCRQKATIFFKGQREEIAIPINTTRENPRKKNVYTQPPSRIDAHRTSFFPSGIKLWNGLPNNIKQSATILEFKSKLENFPILALKNPNFH